MLRVSRWTEQVPLGGTDSWADVSQREALGSWKPHQILLTGWDALNQLRPLPGYLPAPEKQKNISSEVPELVLDKTLCWHWVLDEIPAGYRPAQRTGDDLYQTMEKSTLFVKGTHTCSPMEALWKVEAVPGACPVPLHRAESHLWGKLPFKRNWLSPWEHQLTQT